MIGLKFTRIVEMYTKIRSIIMKRRTLLYGALALSTLAVFFPTKNSAANECEFVDCVASTGFTGFAIGNLKFSAPQAKSGIYADTGDTGEIAEFICYSFVTKYCPTGVINPTIASGCVDPLDRVGAVTFLGGTWDNGTTVNRYTCGGGSPCPGGCD